MIFKKVCTLTDIPIGKGLKVEDGENAVALFTVNGEVMATQDLCSHGLWSLSDAGHLEGDQIVCAIHMGKFCVRSGKVTCIPARKPIKKYPTRVEGENVFVAFDKGYFEE